MTPSNQRLVLQTMYDAVNYLVLNPQHQTTHAMARDGNGMPVMPLSPAACQWCALGRIAHDLDLRTQALFPYHIPTMRNAREVAKIIDNAVRKELREGYLNPLGYSAYIFVTHNDREDPAHRQQGLKDLATIIAGHPALRKGY